MQTYSSLVLENNVSVKSLNFIDSNISLHVENQNNTLNIQILNFYPLLLDASYVGDISAFKKYHPLKGKTQVYAKISYDNKLIVNAKTSLYSSNTEVDIKLDDNGYEVITDIKNLDLLEFEKQNKLDLEELAFGHVDLQASGSFEDIDFKINSNKIEIPKIQSILKPFSLMVSGNYTPKQITFSPYIKNKNYIFSRGNNTYDLKSKTLLLNQQLLIRERKKLIPLNIKADLKLTKPYTAKAFIDTKIHKGLVKLNLNKNYLDLDFNSIRVSTIDNFIDKTLSNLEDALGLNIVKLGKNIINNYKHEDKTTYIKHLELDTTLKNNILTLNDVAVSTKKFRLAAFGDLEKNGDINELRVSILDKNGCVLITQRLKGNIKNPKPQNTSTAILGVASAIPSSLLSTGAKIIDFGAKTIDDVTSFAVEKTSSKTDGISFTSRMVSETGTILKRTSDIILPSECRVVYDGEVKHPIQIVKK